MSTSLPHSRKKRTTRKNPPHTSPLEFAQEDNRLALYCRVSSQEQRLKQTILPQVDFLTSWAALYGYTIAKEYRDEGISGDEPLEERPAGLQMIRDGQAGLFKTVAVYKVDRFARSIQVLLNGYDHLESAGIVFKSGVEPFDTSTPHGKFVFSLLGILAELDKATILERMSLGRDKKLQDGRWLTGSIPRGYVLDTDKRLVPDALWVDALGMDEADMIRMLFLRIAQGASAKSETLRLNALGVPVQRRYANGKVAPVKGGKWGDGTVAAIIHAPVYKGSHQFRSRFGTIERQVTPLVTPDLWAQANAQLQRNRKLPKGNATRVYVLQGLITCGVCKRHYVGQRFGYKQKSYWHYYRHGSRYAPESSHARGGKFIPAPELEAAIWERCKQFILHPQKTIKAITQRIMQGIPAADDLVSQEENLQKRLATKHQEEATTIRALRTGKIRLEAFETEMDTINGEREVLQRELDRLKSRQARHTERVHHLQAVKDRLGRWKRQITRIEREDDRESMQECIQDLTESIVIFSDHAQVTFIFGDKEESSAVLPLSAVTHLENAQSSQESYRVEETLELPTRAGHKRSPLRATVCC